MDRKEIYNIIDGERSYQDRKWGGTEHDLDHTTGDFRNFMRHYLDKADNASTDVEALDEMRKIVALGIACFEVHGVTERTANA